jgi:hypothetical protein
VQNFYTRSCIPGGKVPGESQCIRRPKHNQPIRHNIHFDARHLGLVIFLNMRLIRNWILHCSLAGGGLPGEAAKRQGIQRSNFLELPRDNTLRSSDPDATYFRLDIYHDNCHISVTKFCHVFPPGGGLPGEPGARKGVQQAPPRVLGAFSGVGSGH